MDHRFCGGYETVPDPVFKLSAFQQGREVRVTNVLYFVWEVSLGGTQRLLLEKAFHPVD